AYPVERRTLAQEVLSSDAQHQRRGCEVRPSLEASLGANRQLYDSRPEGRRAESSNIPGGAKVTIRHRSRPASRRTFSRPSRPILARRYEHGTRWLGRVPKSRAYYICVVAHPTAHYICISSLFG